jgi:hypothetical protein
MAQMPREIAARTPSIASDENPCAIHHGSRPSCSVAYSSS